MDGTLAYYSWQEPIGICVLEKIWHESMRESILAYIMKETSGKRFAVKKNWGSSAGFPHGDSFWSIIEM